MNSAAPTKSGKERAVRSRQGELYVQDPALAGTVVMALMAALLEEDDIVVTATVVDVKRGGE
jgi:hypothetical protein